MINKDTKKTNDLSDVQSERVTAQGLWRVVEREMKKSTERPSICPAAQSERISARNLWRTLQYKNLYSTFFAPSPLLELTALFALAPVVVVIALSMLPRPAKAAMSHALSQAMLVAAAGAALFFLTLFLYRLARQRGQLNFNASLANTEPADFVLYLRSFRRTGAIVVPNQLHKLTDRRLLGNFWDVELALSMSLSEKLPVVAIGARASSLGAAKFTTDDQSWRDLALQLAARARAIFIVPDDREGTLWELRQVLTDSSLREKTIVMMPPEQYGWLRRLRRLPSVAHSWERARQELKPHFALPAYSPNGGFLLGDPVENQLRHVDLANFDPTQVQTVIGIATQSQPSSLFDMPSPTEKSAVEEGWRAWIDPVFVLVYILINLALSATVEVKEEGTSSGFDIDLLAVTIAALSGLIVNTSAFTFIQETGESRFEGIASRTRSGLRRALSVGRKILASLMRALDWLYASTWFGLRAAPGFVRASINTFVYVFLVLVIRSFLAEPFKIPSGSMIPTLLIGDLILVNKFSYGVRLPVVHTKIIDVGSPKRGDVMVFRYPQNPSQGYIKRVVGLPGDRISYENRRLRINDAEVALAPAGEFYDSDRVTYSRQYSEELGEIHHKILENLDKPSFISAVNAFPFRDQCNYTGGGVTCTVPPGHYFVMGDNRENSLDSRFWGFVPEANLVGKAFFIWMNFGDSARIGKVQ